MGIRRGGYGTNSILLNAFMWVFAGAVAVIYIVIIAGCETTGDEMGPSTAAVLAEYGVVDCDALRAAVVNQGRRVAKEETLKKYQKIGKKYADELGSPSGVVGAVGSTPISSAPERREMEQLMSAARLQKCEWASGVTE